MPTAAPRTTTLRSSVVEALTARFVVFVAITRSFVWCGKPTLSFEPPMNVIVTPEPCTMKSVLETLTIVAECVSTTVVLDISLSPLWASNIAVFVNLPQGAADLFATSNLAGTNQLAFWYA